MTGCSAIYPRAAQMPLLRLPDVLHHSQNFSTEQRGALIEPEGKTASLPSSCFASTQQSLAITHFALGPVLSDRIGLGTEGFSDDRECTRAGRSCQATPPPLPEPTPSRKPAHPPVLGSVGLRAGRHLPLAGAESHYHFPGQRVLETSLRVWSEALHWLQSQYLRWAEGVVNQGSVFSELSSCLIPVATLAGDRGYGLSCWPSSQVQLALPPRGSAPLGRWPGESAHPCVRQTKCASVCACMCEGWVEAPGLSLIWHPQPCPEPASLPPWGGGSQDTCS